MADRAVYLTKKDYDGDILALGNSGVEWAPRSKHDAIVDIQLDIHRYYVP